MKAFHLVFLLVLVNYQSVFAQSVRCSSVFVKPLLDKNEPLGQSSLMTPFFAVEASIANTLLNKPQMPKGHRVVSKKSQLAEVIDSLPASLEKNRLETLLDLHGVRWGNATGFDLVFGEGGATLWPKGSMAAWAAEFTKHSGSAEARVFEIAKEPQLESALPQWVRQNLAYKLYTEMEAMMLKEDLEKFLRAKSLNLDPEVPDTVKKVLLDEVKDSPYDINQLFTVFGDKVEFTGDALSDGIMVSSVSRAVYNDHKQIAFMDVPYSPIPFEFSPAKAYERGQVDFSKQDSFSPFDFFVMDADSVSWSYRTLYRIAPVEARLNFLKETKSIPFLNTLKPNDFQRLAYLIAAFPELISVPSAWGFMDLSPQGFQTESAYGFYEFKSFHLKESIDSNLYAQLMFEKEVVTPESQKESTIMRIKISKDNPEMLDGGLFEKKELVAIQSKILDIWNRMSTDAGLRESFGLTAQFDPDLVELFIEVQAKSSELKGETIVPLVSVFRRITSDAEFIDRTMERFEESLKAARQRKRPTGP